MYYNLQDFGKEMKNIRTNLGFTQKYISELSGIHVDTLRKIENGKTCPVQETLDLLSPILNKDLNQLLLNYRLNDHLAFNKIKNKLISKMDEEDYTTITTELNELRNLLKTGSNTYFYNLTKQLILLIQSRILEKKYDDLNRSLNMLIKSIKITTPQFNLDHYNSFVYSPMEIRILMNIALILDDLNDRKSHLEILKFCINSIDTNDKTYPKLCHNLSNTYVDMKNYEEALKLSNMAIKSCQENRIYGELRYLYYGKGVAEYNLGKKGYMKSIKTSLYLCEAFGQYKFKKLIIDDAKKLLDIVL